jgi:hypothetical protein
MGVVYKARAAGRLAGKSRKGIPHKLTSARAAQIHRWQMLGAAAKKGQRHAATTVHRTQTAKAKRAVAGTYLKTAAAGTAKILLPTSLVTPLIPGWQPGDRLPGMGHLRRRRR